MFIAKTSYTSAQDIMFLDLHLPSIQIIQYQEKYKLTFQLCMFIKMENMNRPRKLQHSNWKIKVEF
jgi:hypothetical protein